MAKKMPKCCGTPNSGSAGGDEGVAAGSSRRKRSATRAKNLPTKDVFPFHSR